jgi:membrane dipeptidase
MKYLLSASLLAVATLVSLRAETEAELAARAAALHARIFTIDTHVDTPTGSLRRAGWDISQRHDVATDYSQCDFPRMREGGLKAAVFAVFLPQGPRTPEGLAAARDGALRAFLNVHKVAARFPDQCELAFTADDGPRIMATGKRAIYLSIENGYAIGQDLTLIKTYYGLGARIFGITHTSNNDLGDSASDVKGEEWHGLSPLGKDVVKECNRLGLVLDGSHASDTVLRQLIALSATPVILSHSGCKAVNNHPRNIPDDLLRELATHGGVIQMNTLSDYLIPVPPNPAREAARAKLMARFAGRDLSDADMAAAMLEMHRLAQQFPGPRATFDDFLKHLFHAIDVAGADHVGLGADMDGGGGVIGLEDVSGYGQITLALLKHGVADADVEKIWGGNMLRLLRTAEDYATKAKASPAKS